MNPVFRIAAIAGDGIGKEVMPEGLRVVQAAAERFGLGLEIREIAWASCDWYAQHGQGARRAAHDAIVKAIETVLLKGPRTRDLGGNGSTTELGQTIAALVAHA